MGGIIEKVVGDLGDKKRWRAYKARIKTLPPDYHTAIEALERYLMYYGSITNGAPMMKMLDDLADLFEQSVADGTSIRAIVGEDPVAFAEAFLQNYAEGQWINKERVRLTETIDGVAGDRD